MHTAHKIAKVSVAKLRQRLQRCAVRFGQLVSITDEEGVLLRQLKCRAAGCAMRCLSGYQCGQLAGHRNGDIPSIKRRQVLQDFVVHFSSLRFSKRVYVSAATKVVESGRSFNPPCEL